MKTTTAICLCLLFSLFFVIPVFAGGNAESNAELEAPIVWEGSSSVYGTSDIAAGMSFPPFANARQIDFTIAELKKMAIDRIRIAIDWRNREPERGKFYWEPMDRRMNEAKENDISIFLTVASVGPDWASLPSGKDGAGMFDEEAFTAFIDELLLRYEGIDKIQFGNEWEAGAENGTGYTDPESVKRFVTYTNILFDAVQRLSPDTEVILGGLTKTYPMMEYFVLKGNYPNLSGMHLVKGATEDALKRRIDKIRAQYKSRGIKQNIDYVLEHARYDILDIHLYDDAENWSEYLSVLPKDKPILVSEFGGPNSEFENTAPEYQAARMDVYIDAIEELPITEAYYFKLVESDASYHQDSGLFFDDLRIKPARNVFVGRLAPTL